MKKLIVFAALLFIVVQAFAQKNDSGAPSANRKSFGNNINFKSDVLSDGDNADVNITVPDTAIYNVFSAIKKLRSKSHPKLNSSGDILLGVKLDPDVTDYDTGTDFFGRLSRYYAITNNSEAVIVAMGINKNNVIDYRYHVVLNDSVEIVHWSVPKLAQNYGAKALFGMIGKFKAAGNQLLIEVVNVKDYTKARVILKWQTDFKPVIADINVYYKDGEYFDLKNISKNHHFATRFDVVSGVPLDLKFRQGEIANIAWIFDYNPVPYNIYLVKKLPGQKSQTTQITTQPSFNGAFNFGNQNYSKTGKYELVIQPKRLYQHDQTLHIPFEVLPPLPLLQRLSLKQIAPLAIAVIIIIMVCFALYYFYNKRKLRSAERARAMAVVQLKSVRSQLNPHFMFNALTSIQNLMNHHDTIGANNYLNKFADLTRRILNSSGQELISLEDELAIVTNYLQMEQLRFGFQYVIEVAPDVNKANTEIPAMLLQPFIENAAKHGVNALQGKGKIEVTITKQNENLILIVADNGPGFDHKETDPKAFGLKLSREHVALLNDIYSSQLIHLKIDSGTNGVKITITLTNWI